MGPRYMQGSAMRNLGVPTCKRGGLFSACSHLHRSLLIPFPLRLKPLMQSATLALPDVARDRPRHPSLAVLE